MSKKRISLLLAVGLAIVSPLAGASPASPARCRYTVRDVGFVELGNSNFEFWCRMETGYDEALWLQLRGLAATAFRNSNVDVQIVDHDLPAEIAATRASAPAEIPAAVLRAPDGRTLALPLVAGDHPQWADQTLKLLTQIVSSTEIERIRATCLESFAALVIFRGSETEAELEEQRKLAADAMAEFELGMADLPKPVTVGPRRVLSSCVTDGTEPVLRFALGLEDASAGTQIAVLYGRGQRMGPILRRESLTKDHLLDAMNMIGQSCECELDRKWMLGDRIPMDWGEQQQETVVHQLGFDAENPLVKAEISRILARGPGASGTSNEPTTIEDLLMGYSEEAVEPLIPAEEDVTTDRAEHVSGDPAKTIAEPTVPTPAATDDVSSSSSADQPRSVLSNLIPLSLVLVVLCLAIGLWVAFRSGTSDS